MGFRVPNLQDILSFVFFVVLPVSYFLFLFIKIMWRKFKRPSKHINPHIDNLAVSSVFIVCVLLYFALMAISAGNIQSLIMIVIVLLGFEFGVFLLLEVNTFFASLKKPFNIFLVIIFNTIIFLSFFIPYVSKQIARMNQCNNESCRKSPIECINGRLGTGENCIIVSPQDL